MRNMYHETCWLTIFPKLDEKSATIIKEMKKIQETSYYSWLSAVGNIPLAGPSSPNQKMY